MESENSFRTQVCRPPAPPAPRTRAGKDRRHADAGSTKPRIGHHLALAGFLLSGNTAPRGIKKNIFDGV